MKDIINFPLAKLKGMLIRESDLCFERRIIIHDYFIHFSDKICGSISGKMCYNFRTYLDGTNELKNNQFLFEKLGYGFALLLEKGEILRGRKSLCSSKGKTIYWDLINEGQKIDKKSKKTIELKHTLIPFDMENDLESSVSLFNSISKQFDKLSN